MLGIREISRLPDDQKTLLLDVGQIALDLIGIAEPTPAADLTNAVISLLRRDWYGAAISAASTVPYAGDLTKAGKLPRHLQTLDKALRAARSSPAFASLVTPALRQLLPLLENLPHLRMPPSVKQQLARIQKLIEDFLPAGWRAQNRIDGLTEKMLVEMFGSARNIGLQQRANVRTAVEFFERHAVEAGDTKKWALLMRGIDFHAVDAVKVTKLSAGTAITQYADTLRAADRQVGEWMIRSGQGVSPRNLGISGESRQIRRMKLTETVEVLESKAAPVKDIWTLGRTPQSFAQTGKRGEQGQWVKSVEEAELAAGGGTQLFLPNGWKYLR